MNDLNKLTEIQKEILVNRIVIMSILESLKLSEKARIKIFELAKERLENAIKDEIIKNEKMEEKKDE